MKVLRFGLVGPGKVADLHAAALAELPDARLTAVWGRHPDRTVAFADRWGARAVGSLDSLVDDGDVDAVVICTPHPYHVDHALPALVAGRHVLVEKPMALTVADCDRMIGAAERAGVHLGVVSQRRWYPPVQRMRAAVDAGRIGRPALGTVSLLGWRGADYYRMDDWRGTVAGEGGGVLVNQAVHHIDLLLWLMNAPVTAVHGFVSNANHPEIEVEDTAVAVVRFEDGAVGTVAVSNAQRPGLHGRVSVHGTSGASIGVETDTGSAFVAGLSGDLQVPFNHLWTVPGEEELLPRWLAEDRAAGASRDLIAWYHRCQVADFVAAVRDRRPPAVTGEDGRRAVAVIQAIYRSSESDP